MSALLHIKGILVSNLRPDMDEKLKEATLGVLNAIDDDLDFAIYETSHNTDLALARLDAALIGADFNQDEVMDAETKEVANSGVTVSSPYKPRVAPREEDEG